MHYLLIYLIINFVFKFIYLFGYASPEGVSSAKQGLKPGLLNKVKGTQHSPEQWEEQ